MNWKVSLWRNPQNTEMLLLHHLEQILVVKRLLLCCRRSAKYLEMCFVKGVSLFSKVIELEGVSMKKPIDIIKTILGHFYRW